MAKDVLTYSLDFEDGTAEGVHEHGYGDEETVVAAVTKRLGFASAAYFEFESDSVEDIKQGPALIFSSEDSCADGGDPIGRVEYWQTQ